MPNTILANVAIHYKQIPTDRPLDVPDNSDGTDSKGLVLNVNYDLKGFNNYRFTLKKIYIIQVKG